MTPDIAPLRCLEGHLYMGKASRVPYSSTLEVNKTVARVQQSQVGQKGRIRTWTRGVSPESVAARLKMAHPDTTTGKAGVRKDPHRCYLRQALNRLAQRADPPQGLGQSPAQIHRVHLHPVVHLVPR